MDLDEPNKLLNSNFLDEEILNYVPTMPKVENVDVISSYKVELTTKRAVELLLEGTLRSKVCRYCLCVASPLSDLDQIMQIAGKGTLNKVSIRDMVACFHPFKTLNDPNFPKRICNKCLNRTISAYLFTQQCEQSERAMRNCFDDMYAKLEKLDPLDKTKKRGRQKKNPNYNVLYADYEKVIDYAEPIRNIVNISSVSLSVEKYMSDLECPKCWQIFPRVEDLIVHEKTHPSNMWFNCRLCGKSFVKRLQLKRHLKQEHAGPEPEAAIDEKQSFHCGTCVFTCDDHSIFLQHIEKHKFQLVIEHLVEKKMDNLCTVCLDKTPKLTELDKVVRLHGGYPGVTGDKSLYSILGSTLPDMNSSANYTGTKICEKCLNNAITSYVFINHSIYTRSRLNTCVSSMLDSLDKVHEPEGNIIIEIAKESILPIKEQDYFDDNLLLEEDEVDETKLKVDVLEDEFRKPESESESEPEIKDYIKAFLKEDSQDIDMFNDFSVKREPEMDNPAKRVTKTYTNKRLVNGYQIKYPSDNEGYNSLDDVSEFLTFNKKKKPTKRYYKYKFSCPLCNKSFITDFHLQRHTLKHVPKKVECYICSRQFKSKFFLYEHIKMVHILGKTKYFSCETCGRTFEDENRMSLHLNSHLSKECQLCEKIFVSQPHFDSHMRRHAGKMNLVKSSNQICSFCEKDYSNDNQLSLHVNKVHLQIKPYGCDMCERQFYTETNLKKHKNTHNMKSKEKCQLCKKKFNTRKGIVIHLRKHTGETPHRCPVCGKAFYSEIKAKNHMRHYHGGTLYCKLCKSVFSNKYDLKTHVIMVHNHNALL